MCLDVPQCPGELLGVMVDLMFVLPVRLRPDRVGDGKSAYPSANNQLGNYNIHDTFRTHC